MAAHSGAAVPAGSGERFHVLDSLRGIAALAVGLSHISGPGLLLSGPVHENLGRAVDFFFVLSGFVIAASYGERLAQGFSLLRYMVLRIGRVWPLHAVMVLVYIALETGLWLRMGTDGAAGRIPFTGVRDWTALPACFLLLQAWIWPWRELWNVQSWSISVELGLYLGAALAFRVLGHRAWVPGLVLAFSALALLELPSQAGHPVLRGLGGFGLGMACHAAWPAFRRVALPAWAATVAELAVLTLIARLLARPEAPWLWFDPACALAVLVFAREQGLASRVLRHRAFAALGTLSYAFYMVHGLVIGRMFDLIGAVQARAGQRWADAHLGGGDVLMLPQLPALLVAAAMLCAALVVAMAAHRCVEAPARDWSRRFAARIGARLPMEPERGAV
ncbi:acyltransferase [Novosphingobium sp. KCTC 2891]|uniref:acyltransferase family protein n=1 Tax=Novosphingobium sp. KCTC 2891 TaxID=2989730 RepID=UPI00222194FC|nr:acyltransferase [Novosphingobium sp. KCTC 2891]MCW1383971.1 acyltransferase [Novosphingobium sp. KCTC 2891]